MLRAPAVSAVAVLLWAGLSGCMGYLRPFVVAENGRAAVVLSTVGAEQEEDQRTLVFVRGSGGDGDWRRLVDRQGAARAAAAWRGELWLFFPSGCAALPFDEERPKARLVPFEPSWPVQAAVTHQGALWALGSVCTGEMDVQLCAARRGPASDAWEELPPGPPLGVAVSQMSAAGSGRRLWVLWHKRGADGQIQPETFTAFHEDGRWTSGPARDIGRTRFVALADPGGGGVLVAAGGRSEPSWMKWLPHSSPLVLYRLDDSGWSPLPSPGVAWRDSISVMLTPAAVVLEAPTAGAGEGEAGETARESAGADAGASGRPELLVLSGRSGSVAVLRAPLGAAADPGAQAASPREMASLSVDLVSPEIVLVPGLFVSALLVGAGLGMIAVRRRRASPLAPGQPRAAPLLPRGLAWLVDNLLLALVLFLSTSAFGLTLSLLCRDDRLMMLSVLCHRALFVAYAWVFESRWGATPGKLLFGLRLADDFGHRPSGRAALIRNLLRFVDELLIFPMPGLLLVAASRSSRRLGDMLAGTTVTTAAALAEVHEDRRRKSDRFGMP